MVVLFLRVTWTRGPLNERRASSHSRYDMSAAALPTRKSHPRHDPRDMALPLPINGRKAKPLPALALPVSGTRVRPASSLPPHPSLLCLPLSSAIDLSLKVLQLLGSWRESDCPEPRITNSHIDDNGPHTFLSI
ncbi:hypothetical protein V8C44DRAFT_68254 [Trichoderma aethiopicum]